MGLYNEAINIALINNDFDLAKAQASKPSDFSLRKKLWLKIAIYMLKRDDNNIQDVIELTKESGKTGGDLDSDD